MSLTGCVQFIGEARALIGSFKAVVEPMGCDQSSGQPFFLHNHKVKTRM